MCATRKNNVEYTTNDGVVSCQDFDNIDKNIVFIKEFNEKE